MWTAPPIADGHQCQLVSTCAIHGSLAASGAKVGCIRSRPDAARQGAMTLVDAIRETYGVPPRQLAGATLSVSDLERLLACPVAARPQDCAELRASDVRPLLSHHGVGLDALFHVGRLDEVAARSLSLLLAFDGLVVADPLGDISNLMTHGMPDRALQYATAVIPAVASIETLIDSNIIRLSPLRPQLSSTERQPLLQLLGLDPKLTVFTNFAEAAVTAEMMGSDVQSDYLRQVDQLFSQFGIRAPHSQTVGAGLVEVTALAKAIIALSWQLAVCSADTSADVVLGTPLQRELVAIVMNEATASDERDLAKTASEGDYESRHLIRIDAGRVPHLDRTGLSLSDAVAIRSDDSFAAFREKFQGALDKYDVATAAGADPRMARGIFEGEMRDASKALDSSARGTSLKARMTDASVGIGMSAALGSGAYALGGGPWAIGASATGTALNVISAWLFGRHRSTARKIAIRYAVALSGGDSPR